jgi:hypothetical protein
LWKPFWTERKSDNRKEGESPLFCTIYRKTSLSEKASYLSADGKKKNLISLPYL